MRIRLYKSDVRASTITCDDLFVFAHDGSYRVIGSHRGHICHYSSNMANNVNFREILPDEIFLYKTELQKFIKSIPNTDIWSDVSNSRIITLLKYGIDQSDGRNL